MNIAWHSPHFFFPESQLSTLSLLPFCWGNNQLLFHKYTSHALSLSLSLFLFLSLLLSLSLPLSLTHTVSLCLFKDERGSRTVALHFCHSHNFTGPDYQDAGGDRIGPISISPYVVMGEGDSMQAYFEYPDGNLSVLFSLSIPCTSVYLSKRVTSCMDLINPQWEPFELKGGAGGGSTVGTALSPGPGHSAYAALNEFPPPLFTTIGSHNVDSLRFSNKDTFL